jgi:hypothetical protein
VRRLQLLTLALALVVTSVAGFVVVEAIASAGSPNRAPAKIAPRPVPQATVRPKVFVVGDSLTIGARPWMARDLRRRSGRLVGVEAGVGWHIEDGLAVLQRMGDSLPRTVMVALGTNDLLASPRQVDRWMRTARELVGDRRLIWVNLRCNVRHSKLLARYPRFNDALDAAALRYDVEIADWDAWAGRRRVRTLPDGVHYSSAAYRLRSSFYAIVATVVP